MRRTHRITVLAVGCALAMLLIAMALHLRGGRADGRWEEDTGIFTMLLPPDVKGGTGWGEDSFYGKYSSPAMRVSFDSGPYSMGFSGGGNTWPKAGTIQDTTIHGRPAKIGWGPSQDPQYASQMLVYFPAKDPEMIVSVFVLLTNAKEMPTARKILESVQSKPGGVPRVPSRWQRFRSWLRL